MNKMSFPRKLSMSTPVQPQGDDEINLRLIQDFFTRRWSVMLAVTGLAMAVTLFGLLTVTPRYTATAELLLEPGGAQKAFGESILPEFSMESANIESQISVLRSVKLLDKVVRKIRLDQDPEFGEPPAQSLLTRAMNFVRRLELYGADRPKATPTSQNAPVDRLAIPESDLLAISQLSDALNVERFNRTYVLTVSVTSIDPQKAVRIANTIADVYIEDSIDARYDGARRAATWLGDRLASVSDDVRKAELAVSDFRREHNLISMSEDSKVTLGQQQIVDLNNQLATARAASAEAKAKYDLAARVTDAGGDLQSIPDVVRSTVIGQLRSQEAEVSRREAELRSRYSIQNRDVADVQAQHRDIRKTIAREVARIVSNLRDDYEIAHAREASIEETISSHSSRNGMDGSVGLQLRDLERRQAAAKELYDYFQSRAKIAQEQSNFEQTQLRLITPATDPGIPSFPKKTSTMALATIFGLLLGIGAGVALELLNVGFLTGKELEVRLNLPVLGLAPILRVRDRIVRGKLLDPVAYSVARPLSKYAEALRAVRVGLQIANVDFPAKTVMVTSAVPGEGKTTTICALAYSASRAGHRTLLVDCDLRHPEASRFFGLAGEPGVTDILTGLCGVRDVLHDCDGVIVMPAGRKTNNSADLLGSERMRALVAELRGGFDYVFFDAAPLAPVIDARVLAGLVDKIVFVIRWAKTQREIVSQCIDSLERRDAVAGVLLNMIDESKVPNYGIYAYYGGKGYHKYYEN